MSTLRYEWPSAQAPTVSRELRVFVCPPLAEFAQRVGHIRCASADVVVKVRSGEREEEREEIGFSMVLLKAA